MAGKRVKKTSKEIVAIWEPMWEKHLRVLAKFYRLMGPPSKHLRRKIKRGYVKDYMAVGSAGQGERIHIKGGSSEGKTVPCEE